MKHVTRILLMLTALLYCLHSMAQEPDLLKLAGDSLPEKTWVTSAFKSSRVINNQSMEMIGKGVLDVRILHRFGVVSDGISNFFGLDQASMRTGFDYGVTRNLTVGFGRSTFHKELDGLVKWRILQQSAGAGSNPVSLLWVSGITYNGTSMPDSMKADAAKYRLAYYHQLIIGRKFSDRFSLQLSPTLVHRNLVAGPDEKNDVFALAVGGRLKLSNRIALVVDYDYVMTGINKDNYTNPLGVGIDIETGGHVFQLHFSNATGMNERAFITETTNKWDKGEIRFGFNLSRVFNVGGRKK